MHIAKKLSRWLAPVCVLLGTLVILLVLYRVAVKPSAFLTTYSPRGTYIVNLTGRKERPLFFTNEVRFDVLKNGKPFVSEKRLHSGDAFDLSFEFGYPDQRWLDENILRFYREQNFNEGKSDNLIVVNKMDKVIKYLIIYSTDKFLIFDLQPDSETKLPASRPRGDVSGFSVKGEFSEGRSFKKGAGFKIRKELDGPFTYHIYITDDSLTIESPQLEKYIRVGTILTNHHSLPRR